VASRSRSWSARTKPLLIGVGQRPWDDVVGLESRDHAAPGDVTDVDWCSAVGGVEFDGAGGVLIHGVADDGGALLPMPLVSTS
jgi:hypothetical protein